MNASPSPESLLTTSQAADYCDVDRRTMLRWVESGQVRGHRTPGGRWRIRLGDLSAFMRQRGMPLPQELDPGPPRIAIVDDDPAHVNATRRFLEGQLPGVEVRAAYDGFGAGMLVKELEPHLLLLDVFMPGLDGFDVCEAIRSDSSLDALAVFAVSSHMTADNAARLTGLGADACIAKVDLVRALRPVLERLRSGERRLR
jgi:excisionase family DNA binding protein